MSTSDYMAMALAEAEAAAHADEVPVGAVIVAADGTVLARTGNAMRRANDPTAHAEMLALREACATLGTDRLPDCDLYVTLEPCGVRSSGAASCARRLAEAGVARVVIASRDASVFAAEQGPAHLRAAGVAVEWGLLEAEAARLYEAYRPAKG